MLRRLIPQALVRSWCARRGHRLRRYSAQKDGRVCVVHTCRCGAEQMVRWYEAEVVRFPRKRR